jgi:hypothetical protein
VVIPWSYSGKPVDKYPEGAVAFVYYLEFKDGAKYVGKKGLVSTRKKKIAGKSRRQITRTESNWKSYLSSSTEVKAKIKAGDILVKREITRWCFSLSEATYWELYEQMVNHVLLKTNWLNLWVSARIYGSSLNDSRIT